jgi:ribosomal protein S18 acetylase RimI-like enzyme
MIIRKATKSNLENLVYLNSVDGYPWECEMYKYDFKRFMERGDTFLILENGGAAQGYISITNKITKDSSKLILLDKSELANFENAQKIHLLSVRKTEHRNGYGTALMEKAIDNIKEAGKSHVYLFVPPENTKAISFYSSLDFQVKGIYPNKYTAGKHALFIGKKL